jgi:hypothetical protein
MTEEKFRTRTHNIYNIVLIILCYYYIRSFLWSCVAAALNWQLVANGQSGGEEVKLKPCESPLSLWG